MHEPTVVHEPDSSGGLVDLAAIKYTAIGLLVALDAHARAQARRVVLVRGPDHVHRVFRITRLEHQLEFVDHPTDLSRPARREP